MKHFALTRDINVKVLFASLEGRGREDFEGWKI